MTTEALAPLRQLQDTIIACTRCPRLLAYQRQVAHDKVRRFRQEAYWSKPVPSFGDPAARLVIVGLAPAAHGGNRTGAPSPAIGAAPGSMKRYTPTALPASPCQRIATMRCSCTIAILRRCYTVLRQRTSRRRRRRPTARATYSQNCGCSVRHVYCCPWGISPLLPVCGPVALLGSPCPRPAHASATGCTTIAPTTWASWPPIIPASKIPRPGASRARCFMTFLPWPEPCSTRPAHQRYEAYGTISRHGRRPLRCSSSACSMPPPILAIDRVAVVQKINRRVSPGEGTVFHASQPALVCLRHTLYWLELRRQV